MKKFFLLSLLWVVSLVGVFFQSLAQEYIPQQQSMKKVLPLQSNFRVSNETKILPLNVSLPSYGFSISGKLSFSSPDGYFKAVLHTTSGHEYLIYREIGVLNNLNQPIDLEGISYETALLYGEIPSSVEFVAMDCSFRLTGLSVANQPKENLKNAKKFALRVKQLKREAQQRVVDKINKHNRRNKIAWVAGVTSTSELPYEQKKHLFGDLPETQTFGWEYYRGGILSYINADYSKVKLIDTTTEPYVERFSWTNRHGINWNSPLYNQWDETGNYTGTCWAYAPKSTIEAFVNLYLGASINPNTSIQEIVSCSGGKAYPSTDYELKKGGYPSYALRYIQSNGVIGETDFPWQQLLLPCDHPSKKKNPSIWYRPERVTLVSTPNDEVGRLELMKHIIQKGPMSVVVNEANHVMSLVGWGMIKPGKFLEYWGTDYITVDETHPLANKVYWIFKNSCGEGWGYKGYACIVRGTYLNPADTVKNNECFTFSGAYYFDGKLECKKNGEHIALPKIAHDDDGDGYYRWGFAGKPEGLNAPDIQDADDSDPTIGPMDQYGKANKLKKYDLYVRDHLTDKGVEPNTFADVTWESPDIWVRCVNDNGTENEDPTFIENSDMEEKTVYVKVRIHNKGNAPSSALASLAVRWTMEQAPLHRRDFFNHSLIFKPWVRTLQGEGNNTKLISYPDLPPYYTTSRGGLVDEIKPIPVIQPGESAVITFEWTVKNPRKLGVTDPSEWKYSLLAEINALDDGYHTPDAEKFSFYKYVGNNNNVALKSETIREVYIEPIGPGSGGLISIGDDLPKSSHYRPFDVYGFDITRNGSLSEEADFKLSLQKNRSLGLVPRTIEGLEETVEKGVYKVTSKQNKLAEITPQSGDTIVVNAQINFLTKQMTDNTEYRYRIVIKDHETGEILGGRTYCFKKRPRTTVVASIRRDDVDPSLLNAVPICEEATYKWKDELGNTVAEGVSIDTKKLQPMSRISLEVTAKQDGFKDTETKEVEIVGRYNSLQIIPNPVKDVLTLSYPFESEKKYSLVITGELGGIFSYTIDQALGDLFVLDVKSLSQGNYVISLFENTELVAIGKFSKKE